MAENSSSDACSPHLVLGLEQVDLVDQERVPAIEEKVKLSPLGGSLRGRREVRRGPGSHRSPADGPASNVLAVRAARSRSGRSTTGFSIGGSPPQPRGDVKLRQAGRCSSLQHDERAVLRAGGRLVTCAGSVAGEKPGPGRGGVVLATSPCNEIAHLNYASSITSRWGHHSDFVNVFAPSLRTSR